MLSAQDGEIRMADSLVQLAELVSRLGVECPWTKAQGTQDMLFYTRKECLEVEECFRAKELDKTHLTKELGDVLFDVLMMIEVTHREHREVTVQACAASACQKLRKRSPYLFGGAAVKTLEEAEQAWQAGKLGEQSEAKAHPERSIKQMSTVEAAQGEAACASPSDVEPASGYFANGKVSSCYRQGEGSLPLQPSSARDCLVRDMCPDEDATSVDSGLAEWEADFRRGAGPESDSEEEDDCAVGS